MDVKRLAASFEVAGRHRGFSDEERRGMRLAAVRGYRERMIAAAESSVLDAWYERPASRVLQTRHEKRGRRDAHRRRPAADRSGGDVLADRNEILDTVDSMRSILASYQSTLLIARHPLAEYTYVHMARKVVGVGSVGTRAWIVLLTGADTGDPLFLQAKEAQPSVLERFLGPSEYASHGERVVRGQRRMQASSDIFLGWQSVRGDGGIERDFYVRQLHDWKGSIDPELMVARGALLYARICGETLARAHARSGDRVEIAAYLGRSDAFDEAISEFSVSYADQNEADYRAFTTAIESGRLNARVT